MSRMLAGVVVVTLAVVAALAPAEADVVERWYATALYPHIQRSVTSLTNRLPLAVLDMVMVALAVGVVWMLVRAVRATRRARNWRPVAWCAWRLVVLGATLYLLFLALWGLNYRRVPMTQRIEVGTGTPDTLSVVMLGLMAVTQLNELHASAHARGWGDEEWRDPALRTAFAQTQTYLTDALGAEPGRLKHTLLGPYFRWASVDGMVNPLGLEVLANPDLLPWERPFVAAHEWAHLAGFAHEAEANFVGWLTCIRADAPARYSGWLFLYWQVISEVSDEDRQRISSGLSAGPRNDIDAIVERLQRGQFPLLRRISWRMYDQYLKANRVEQGVRSYSEVVNLILLARFDDEWVPVRRGDPRDR